MSQWRFCEFAQSCVKIGGFEFGAKKRTTRTLSCSTRRGNNMFYDSELLAAVAGLGALKQDKNGVERYHKSPKCQGVLKLKDEYRVKNVHNMKQ